MAVETIERCDICWREVPLDGVRGQIIYRGRFSSSWHWPGRREEPHGDQTICEECWDGLRDAIRNAAREREAVSATESAES